METGLRNIGKTGVILTLVALAALTGCTINSVTLNRRAQVYIDHGDYAQAEALLKESVKVNYENSPSHYWLGHCYQAQGDNANALWEYGIAVRFDPALEIAQMALIQGLHNDGQVEKSVEATKTFLNHKNAEPRHFMRLGKTFMDQQMPQQGVLAYLAAAKADPYSAVPFITIADYFFANGNKEKGIEYLTLGFKANPIHPGLAKRLGQLGLRVNIPQPQLFQPPSKLDRELLELHN